MTEEQSRDRDEAMLREWERDACDGRRCCDSDWERLLDVVAAIRAEVQRECSRG